MVAILEEKKNKYMKYEVKIENPRGVDWSKRKFINGRRFCLNVGSSFISLFSIVTAIILLIVSIETTAQVKKYQTRPTTEVASEEKTQVKSVQKKRTGSSAKKIIRGQIRDSISMKSIPRATVFLKGGNMQVQADSNGYFQMTVPGRLVKDKITLVVAAEWYFNKEFVVARKELNSKKEFILNQRETITVEAKATPRKKKWWELKKKK